MSLVRSVIRPLARSMVRPPTARSGGWSPRALFAAGDLGFWYDPSDLSTQFQDSVGTTPVTAAGNPLGLVLDKSRGAARGAELVTTPAVNLAGTASAVGPALVTGGWYEVAFTVAGYSGTGDVGFDGTTFTASAATRISANGTVRGIVQALGGPNIGVFTRATNTANFSGISVKSLTGSHLVQGTAGARPVRAVSPARIDYDGVDDSLVATFASSLGSACTVARAVPGGSASILTGQTIGTSYNDSTDSCGLVVINRALTAAETAQLTQYLNAKAVG